MFIDFLVQSWKTMGFRSFFIDFPENQVGSGHPTLSETEWAMTMEAFRAFRTLRELCWEMVRKGLVSKAGSFQWG